MKKYIKGNYDWSFTHLIDSNSNKEIISRFLNDVEINRASDLLDSKDTIQDLYDAYFNDLKKFPRSNSMDSLDSKYDEDHGRFYKKWRVVIDNCKVIIKNISVAGYGRYDYFILKLLDKLKSMEYNFPYGWKHDVSRIQNE